VEHVDIARRLRDAATAAPDRTALRWDAGDAGRLTYGELDARVDAAVAVLQARGVGPGDRVALVIGTRPSFAVAALGTLRAGAAVVPLLPGLAPDELRHALADSGARTAVVGPERAGDVAALRGELPDLVDLLVADVEVAPDGAERFEDLLATAGTPTEVERTPDSVGAIVYTSGTTGRPRGAVLTRGNLAANQDQSLAGRFRVGPDDVVLLVLPLAHIYALNVGLGASLAAGATMVLVDRFDPEASLRTIAEHGVTVVLGAPPMYVAWLEAGHLDAHALRSVRLAVSGAAPLPVQVFERFQALTGLAIEEGYGLTEAGPSVASSAMADAPRAGSVGLPLPDVELRLVDDEGQDVEPGDPGEVWVRGPNVFAGYWNDPEATAAALTPDGWLRTGDVATRAEDGMLYLVDRKRDLILVNGFNVYPREVERVLYEDERVAQAAAFGVPHVLTGETVVAAVVARAGQELDPDELIGRCLQRLARYKCPTRIDVLAELPTTASGKIRRGMLGGT
jgi:long-chain acyl-CoA synthetase